MSGKKLRGGERNDGTFFTGAMALAGHMTEGQQNKICLWNFVLACTMTLLTTASA
jgi:hypothetical protein